MSSHRDKAAPAEFLNYPTAKAHDAPLNAHTAPSNPVLKGQPLYYLSAVVARLPPLQSFLWRNAGFNVLRELRELDTIEARLDPTVVHAPQPSEEPIDHTNELTLRVPPDNASGRFHTIVDYHDAYKSGRVTPYDVIEALLPLICRDNKKRSIHSTAFVDTNVELVTQAAEASTRRWKRGKPLGILDGVPFAVKDEIDVKGYKRYAGTKIDYTKGMSVETSWCAQKLEEAGAVLLGKLNMHELGLDTTNNNPHWGTPLNPYNKAYYTGGSSGGSAYAVASGLVPFALGSDGGGSIRIPANYCGLYGLKPSHGRVSIAPLQQTDPSTTVQGPLAGSMADLEVSYHVLAQPDPSHFLSRQFTPPKPIVAPRSKKIGIYKAWFDRADPFVRDTCQAAIDYFAKSGYQLVDITIPHLHEGQLAHAMTILNETLVAQPDVSQITCPNKVLLKVASQTTARDLLLAQRLRHLLMQHLAQIFQDHPGIIIVTPTTPNAGWPIGDGELAYGMSDGNSSVRNMEYVWLANFTGLPCIQLPVGYVNDKNGHGIIPVGLSGNGEWGSEEELIEFGYDGERYLNEAYDGGRLKPERWVDVLELSSS